MAWFVRRNLFAGVASACVVGLGIVMVWPIFSRYGEEPVFSTVQATIEADIGPPEESVAPLTPSRPTPSAPPARLDEQVELADLRASGELQLRKEADKATRSERVQTKIEPKDGYASAAPQQEGAEEIVVTGVRARLQASMEMKRQSTAVVDAIMAEDIGALPDANVAQSLQRIPGITTSSNNALALPAPESELASEAGDKFQHFEVNPLRRVADEPVSTFSVDVDTASYSFARRMLNEGRLPQKDAVRVEEMVNYFDYAWPAARSAEVPFEPTVVVSESPWGKGKRLVHIGVKGYEIQRNEAPDANLVLLLDVSGSMDSPDKLPLAVSSMELLLGSLKPTDTVAIVVYAGAAGTVLEPTPVREKEKILGALRNLTPGGSTAGAEGIERAYQLAAANFRKGGVNRILLATDGDFNVGIDDTEQLKGYIERQREKGIFLSVLGFGQGNYRDELAQALAQNGNGVAVYIDTLNEARKVLVQEATSSLFTIAQDVKLQVEFNPATVAEYRLVGYETRALRREDFNNDAIDAGDVGSGHTVTAIYEITPVGSQARLVDEARYSENRRAASRGSRDEYGFLKIRYKLPGESKSRLLERPIPLASGSTRPELMREVTFSTAVAGFGQLLRGGKFTGPLSYEDVIRQAQSATGEDRFGYRAEFVQLVRKAQAVQRK
jgi:Ca-activated chloride channel family protein